MSARNGYAALVKQRASGETKRRRLDDYETPDSVTQRCLARVKFRGPILEPACGSGRMVRVLKAAGYKVTGSDIKEGHDFLKRAKDWDGDIVSNPPYRDGLAEMFVRHALELATGQVAMLLQSGFIWGDKRGSGLYREFKPAHVIVIPERIYFLVNGKPIPSQFFSHAAPIAWAISRRSHIGQQTTR
jgi:SAM-dependent methyltransferase